MKRPITMAVLLLCAAWLPTLSEAQMLANGTLDLLQSSGPGHPDFNSALTANHTMPLGIAAAAGAQVTVALRDVSRPSKVCDLADDFGDLFNGCAAVDWPFPGRRGINLLQVETTSGLQTLHLRMADTLSATPEPDGP